MGDRKKNVVEKAFLAGARLAHKGGEKLDEGVRELVRSGELTKAEAEQLLKKAAAVTERQSRSALKVMRKNISVALTKMTAPTTAEFNALAKRVARLEKAVKGLAPRKTKARSR